MKTTTMTTRERLNKIAFEMFNAESYQSIMKKTRIIKGVQCYGESELSKLVFDEYIKQVSI